MKNLLIAFCCFISFQACKNVDKKNEHDLEVVKKFVESVESFNYSTMKDMLTDDYLGLGPNFGDSINKETAVENWQYNVEYLYKEIKYTKAITLPVTIPSGPNKGNYVAKWAQLDIIYKDGNAVTLYANTLYLIRGEQIAKTFTLYNEADAYRQLGYTFQKLEE